MRVVILVVWLAVMIAAKFFLAWYIPMFGTMGFLTWMSAMFLIAFLIDCADRRAAQKCASKLETAREGDSLGPGVPVELVPDSAGVYTVEGTSGSSMGEEPSHRTADRATH